MALLFLCYAVAVGATTWIQVGELYMIDTIRDLKVVNGIAYVAAGTSGLVAIDVKEPGNAQELYRVWTGYASGIDVVGDTIFVADRESGVLRITAGYVDGWCPEYCESVQVSEGITYARTTRNTILAVNMTSDLVDTFVYEVLYDSHEKLGSVRNFFVAGTILYCLTGSVKLTFRIFDFSDPYTPLPLGSVETNVTFAGELFVSGTTAYAATGEGLLIFGVEDPLSPSFITTFTDSVDGGVYIANNTAYIADYLGLTMVNVSTPDSPILLSTRPSAKRKIDTRIRVEGTTAYVAKAGIQMLDVSNSSAPVLLEDFNQPCGARDVAVSGNYAYLVGSKTLQVIDISNPVSPTVVGSYDEVATILGSTGKSNAVQVVGSIAYVASCPYFYAFNVSVPHRPTILGKFEPGGLVHCAHSVHVSGTIAYVGSNSDGLQLLDIRNPSKISLISTFPDLYASDVIVSGKIAYVAGFFDGLVLLDVETPSTPMFISSVNIDGRAEAIAIRLHTVYVTGNKGLYVVDTSNPRHPVTIGTLKVGTTSAAGVGELWGGSNDLDLIGDSAVISFQYGLELVDISSPSSPIFIDYFSIARLSGEARGISCVGDMVYVADAGMSLIRIEYINDTVGSTPPEYPRSPSGSGSNTHTTLVIVLIAAAVLLVMAAFGVWCWRKNYSRPTGDTLAETLMQPTREDVLTKVLV